MVRSNNESECHGAIGFVNRDRMLSLLKYAKNIIAGDRDTLIKKVSKSIDTITRKDGSSSYW